MLNRQELRTRIRDSYGDSIVVSSLVFDLGLTPTVKDTVYKDGSAEFHFHSKDMILEIRENGPVSPDQKKRIDRVVTAHGWKPYYPRPSDYQNGASKKRDPFDLSQDSAFEEPQS